MATRRCDQNVYSDWTVLGSVCALLATLSLVASNIPTSAGPPHQLRRRPYLTDLLQRHVVVNWATTAAVSNGWVRYGKVRSGNCTTHRVDALQRTIVVDTTREHQWRASLDGLNPNTRYCYRIYGDGVGLLGHARAPRFRTQVKHGGTAPFSFAVLGDWGAVDANGKNPDQAAVLHQIAQSPARFAVSHRRHRAIRAVRSATTATSSRAGRTPPASSGPSSGHRPATRSHSSTPRAITV